MGTLGQGRVKSVLLWTMAAMGLFFIAGPASLQAQQDFPSKPITIIVPFGPGGIIDVGTRIFAERLSKELKVPVVIENKAGGAGLIGSSAFLNTAPDGYTLLSASGAAVISTVQLSKTPAFDPRKDFLPVGYIADAPCAMSVAKNAPFKTYEEFLKYAKANPGKLRGGVSSLGGETHIMFEAILKQAKIESKMVPYPATGGLVTAIMGGHLDWMCLSLPGNDAVPQVRRREDRAADPEVGGTPGRPGGRRCRSARTSRSTCGWDSSAHPKTPKPAYDKLVAAVTATAKDPEVAKKLSDAGFTSGVQGPPGLFQADRTFSGTSSPRSSKRPTSRSVDVFQDVTFSRKRCGAPAPHLKSRQVADRRQIGQ